MQPPKAELKAVAGEATLEEASIKEVGNLLIQLPAADFKGMKADDTYSGKIDWDILSRNWQEYIVLQIDWDFKGKTITYPKVPEAFDTMTLWEKIGGIEAIQIDLASLHG